MRRFNLIDDPWIPVVRHDGSMAQLGLAELLAEAPDVKDLACASPIEQVATVRLLLAVCHRAAPIRRPSDAATRFAGQWPSGTLRGYLAQHRDRFDLFDGDAPFMQMPWLARHPKSTPYPIAKIVAGWATGNEKTLMSHHDDGHPGALDFAAAARALVAHQQFALGGLSKVFRTSAKGAPGTGFAHCWIVGDSLAQTLVLAQFPVPSSIADIDLPAWERPVPTEADVDKQWPYPVGPATVYTWISRAVLLRPEDSGRVAHVHWAEGLEYLAPDNAMDPMESRRPGTKGTVSFHFSNTKALWRNFHAMTTSGGQPARTLVHAAGVVRTTGATPGRTVRAAGLLADKAKILLWRNEDHTIPVDIAVDPARATAVVQMISLAEECGRAFEKALVFLAKTRLGYPRAKPSPDALKALSASLPGRRMFWSSLEPGFAEQMLRLCGTATTEDVLEAWRLACREALKSAWTSSVDALGNRGAALAAAGAAASAFATALGLCRSEEVVP